LHDKHILISDRAFYKADQPLPAQICVGTYLDTLLAIAEFAEGCLAELRAQALDNPVTQLGMG
jgi:hypothetical protein